MNEPLKRDLARVALAKNAASPEHKRFNTLLGKIEKARERLAHWHEQAPRFAEVHAEQVQPSIDAYNAKRRAWAFELEQLLLSRRWAKADAQTLRNMICDMCGVLMELAPQPDAELKALYNRVAETDFDTQQQQDLQQLKAFAEMGGGLELGDGPIDSIDDLMQRVRAGFAEQNAEAAKAETAPRKPARKTAAQKRAEEDALRVSQTVRTVYRKLAAALHPDRAAPDATLAQREERTQAMARANAAYEAGDLLALLSLQLQIEQVDLAHAAGVAAEQVRHFNKLLAEQLAELEAEIDDRQHALCMSYGVMVERRLDPLKLGALLQDLARDVLTAQAELDHQCRGLRSDPPTARRWLKRIAEEQRFDEAYRFF
jgi:hypothetical protein